MRNLTRKQKKNLRDLITGFSGCMVIALILIVHSLINRQEHVPVVFSDILDGATVTAGTGDEAVPTVTLEENYLYERLFESETAILTTIPTSVSSETEDNFFGAGGTILINTTHITPPTEISEEITEASVEVTDTIATSSLTTSTTTEKISAAVTTPKATTATTTTTAYILTAAPVTTTSKTPFINIGGGVVSQDEEVYIEMLNLVNKERKKAGLNELWYSARVHEIAALRAYELSSYYSHSRSDGRGFHTAFLDNGIRYRTVGENIAYGRNMFETVEEVFEAWMNSESHRENILNPEYECAGFGLSVLKVGKDTYYYWSQEFAKF